MQAPQMRALQTRPEQLLLPETQLYFRSSPYSVEWLFINRFVLFAFFVCAQHGKDGHLYLLNDTISTTNVV
jgi:hypothetical protein